MSNKKKLNLNQTINQARAWHSSSSSLFDFYSISHSISHLISIQFQIQFPFNFTLDLFSLLHWISLQFHIKFIWKWYLILRTISAVVRWDFGHYHAVVKWHPVVRLNCDFCHPRVRKMRLLLCFGVQMVMDCTVCHAITNKKELWRFLISLC